MTNIFKKGDLVQVVEPDLRSTGKIAIVSYCCNGRCDINFDLNTSYGWSFPCSWLMLVERKTMNWLKEGF